MVADPLNPLAWHKRGSGIAAAQHEPEQALNNHKDSPGALQLLAGFLAKIALLGVTVYIRARFRLPRLLEEACQSDTNCLLPLSVTTSPVARIWHVQHAHLHLSTKNNSCMEAPASARHSAQAPPKSANAQHCQSQQNTRHWGHVTLAALRLPCLWLAHSHHDLRVHGRHDGQPGRPGAGPDRAAHRPPLRQVLPQHLHPRLLDSALEPGRRRLAQDAGARVA